MANDDSSRAPNQNRPGTGFKIGVALLGLVVVGGVLFTVFPSNSHQGYAPEQPIPFSHKIHAGQNKMDCRYCHYNVDRSPHASIPTLSVCMNCHKVVKTESPYIKKLTEAYESGRPIEWIRIHELPDHARFSHKRHVTKGLQCETCHGDVKEMDRVVQENPLTMGWCLECHRGQTTPSYVRELIHKDASNKDPVAPFSCATCHY